MLITENKLLSDSNVLNTKFYFELLHIIGLEELLVGRKSIIKQKKEKSGETLLENTITELQIRNNVTPIEKIELYGDTRDDQFFNIAVELNFTWISRILFLKFLESQLITFHNRYQEFAFLNHAQIANFGQLENLFFQVFAKKKDDRNSNIAMQYAKLPYLNSSLFIPTDLEKQSIFISQLNSNSNLSLYKNTILKNAYGTQKSGTCGLLQYMFDFLDAYNYSSGMPQFKENKDTLINSAVLGLIFERINGYKEGAFFTPEFITRFMCNETIRRMVVDKFRALKISDFTDLTDFTDLRSKIDKIPVQQANEIVDSIKICDPAVGAGHFLVSALNELICIKAELGILCSKAGRRLHNLKIEIEGDELVIFEHSDTQIVKHNYSSEKNELGKFVVSPVNQEVQETIFYDAQKILENCIFGIDINPNFINITRLRLWIELLKHIFYTEESGYTALQTLPDITQNLQQANTVLPNFKFDFAKLTNTQTTVCKGFDIIIGNPPYIKEYDNRAAFDGLRDSPVYQGKMDLWYLFGAKGIEMLNENGYLCYIAPNNWTTNTGASKFRNYIVQNAQIISIIDLGAYFVFSSSDIQTMILMFKKNTTNDNYTFDYRHVTCKKPTLAIVLNVLNKHNTPNAEFLTPKLVRDSLVNKSLHFVNSDIETVLQKIQHKANFALQATDLANAIIPNPDYINSAIIGKIPDEKQKKYGIKMGDGVFVVQAGFFTNLTDHEKKYLKPLIEATQVDRYTFPATHSHELIYFTKRNFNGDGCPNLLEHLEKFKEIMVERRETANGSMEYYHVHWSRNERFFTEGAKILSIRKCTKPTFVYTEKEAYTTGKFYVIKTERINLKYLIGVLNSKLIQFWLRYRGKMQGDIFQIDKQPIMELPIINVANNYTESIIEKVDKILKLKAADLKSDTSLIEHEINLLIYKLYGLDWNDINIIQ